MQPGHTIRDYVLEQRIDHDEGAMGEVWRARHHLLQRLVAIKVIAELFETDSEFETRFLQEAQVQAQLRHPRIVPVTDFFHDQGRYYLVMPLVEGPSLQGRIEAAGGPLSLPEALQIAHDVLDALDYAHQHGVIHRDVKPSNILLDHEGHASLMDFGIALTMHQARRTQTGTSIGTPYYMSPEQILRPKTLDHRTDVYSFGCVLYEMVAGHPPFETHGGEGDTDFLIKQAHVHQRPPPVRQWNPAVSEALEAVVMRTLAKDPNARYSGCGAVWRALAQATSGPRAERKGSPRADSPGPSIGRRGEQEAAQATTVGTTATRMSAPRRWRQLLGVGLLPVVGVVWVGAVCIWQVTRPSPGLNAPSTNVTSPPAPPPSTGLNAPDTDLTPCPTPFPFPPPLIQLREAIEQGRAWAQYDLGRMYECGHAVPQNYQYAVLWYRKAAEQGFDPAQYELGRMYEQGLGVPQDYQQALLWYRKAAAQGSSRADAAIQRIQYIQDQERIQKGFRNNYMG